MKARKLLLKPYKVAFAQAAPRVPCPHCGEVIEPPQQQDYQVVDSLLNILLSGHLVRPPAEYLKAATLGDRIQEAGRNGNEFVLLEAAEWDLLKDAFEKWPRQQQGQSIGFGRFERELVRRVFEAEEIPVKEK